MTRLVHAGAARADLELPCLHCGYDVRGLAHDSRCPECGSPVADALEPPPEARRYSAAEVRWARLVLLGLALWLGGTVASIGVVLYMPFSERFGGTVPRLNYIGPKVWAVSLMQRGLGYAPGSWGNHGVAAGLAVCVGVVLLTSPRTETSWREPLLSPRAWSRWIPTLLFGGFLGLTLGCEGVHQDDPQVNKFILAGVVGVELPATVLLYWHLRSVAGSLQLPETARTFTWAAGAIALLLIAAAVTLTLGRHLAWERNRFPMQLGVSVYMAGSVAVASAVVAALAQVALALLPMALHRGRPALGVRSCGDSTQD